MRVINQRLSPALRYSLLTPEVFLRFRDELIPLRDDDARYRDVEYDHGAVDYRVGQIRAAATVARDRALSQLTRESASLRSVAARAPFVVGRVQILRLDFLHRHRDRR